MTASQSSPSVVIALDLSALALDTADGVEQLISAAQSADVAGADLVTLDDPLTGAADGRPRLAATEAAAFVARRTGRIGLFPATSTHYTEPFFGAKASATLDHASNGRGGVVLDPRRTDEADRYLPNAAALSADQLDAQAAEYAEVLRELWDSWEDDAAIRDAATSRYVDASRIHHIHHRGQYFQVKGPLVTPRPPQGNPLVAVRTEPGAHGLSSPLLVARADIVIVQFSAGDSAAPAVAASAAGVDAVVGAGPDALTSLLASGATVLARVAASSVDAIVAEVQSRLTQGFHGVEVIITEPLQGDIPTLLAALGARPTGATPAPSPLFRERLGRPHIPSRYASNT
ncbi:LLM class flavin-dependent oxidoreductase [Plantibacter sp. Mn2098]|uniref:LLM class flavin-dependent oxidoreductase n=1 Tax=Plantibacter sp. Mn2098 TaxID=3395266 RepID=UPI003BE6B722